MLKSSDHPRPVRHIQQAGGTATAINALQPIVIRRRYKPQLFPRPVLPINALRPLRSQTSTAARGRRALRSLIGGNIPVPAALDGGFHSLIWGEAGLRHNSEQEDQ